MIDESIMIQKFFDLMFEEFNNGVKYNIKTQPDEVNKWLEKVVHGEGIVYNEDEVIERIKKKWLEGEKYKKVLERWFKWLWLDYSPKNKNYEIKNSNK